LVKIRKASPILKYGKFTLLDHDNPNVFAYTRELEGKKVLILLNFTGNEAAFDLGFSTKHTTLILGNYPNKRSLTSNTLRPYESLILELK
jgi:oligo-1,6-glucosidase